VKTSKYKGIHEKLVKDMHEVLDILPTPEMVKKIEKETGISYGKEEPNYHSAD
jgi:hypothetical protein